METEQGTGLKHNLRGAIKAARFRARPYILQVSLELINGGRILPEEIAALGEP